MYSLLACAALYSIGYSRGRLARPALLLGLAVHAASIAKRAALLGGLPVTERLDTLSLIGFFMAAMVFYVWRRYDARGIEVYLISFAVFFTLAASLHAPVNSTDMFMRSPWFHVYSVLNITGYVLLGVATSFGLLYMHEDKRRHEELQYWFTLSGWSVFSVSLIAGGVWFYLAHGSYWYWTAREFWLSMTWFMYGGIYLHSRYLKEFSGKPAALIGILGYPMLVFYYFGIGTLVKSPWSQF